MKAGIREQIADLLREGDYSERQIHEVREKVPAIIRGSLDMIFEEAERALERAGGNITKGKYDDICTDVYGTLVDTVHEYAGVLTLFGLDADEFQGTYKDRFAGFRSKFGIDYHSC